MIKEGKINAHTLEDNAFSKFDKAIEWLLILLLAFSPIVFGAVEAWSEEVVIALAAAISITFLAKLAFVRTARFIWSWAYVPLAIFVFIALLQLVSLPTGLLELISPNTVAIKRELLSDLLNSNEVLDRMTLTFYRNATKHDLRLVLAVVAVFIAVFNVLRRPDQVKRLLAAIAIIGGVIAFLTLAQDLFGNGKIYWYVPISRGQAYSGPFVNHNHYGQFMNLSIGAALGLIMVRIHEAFVNQNVTPQMVGNWLVSPEAKVIWALVSMTILGATTIFVSLSRGSMVSMLIAGAFTTLLLSSRQSIKGRGWIITLMALGAFICVLYIGFDAVYDRLADLRDIQMAKGSRWQIAKDIAVIWTKFPLLGTGLGTHEVAYPMFDRSTISAIAAHANNEYAQAAEEIGLVGLLTLLLLAVVVWKGFIQNITIGSIPIRSAAYGLGFGLLAIMIHSLSDFGQHLPANATLSAVFCALLLALTKINKGEDSFSSTRCGASHPSDLSAKVTMISPVRIPLYTSILLGLCLMWGWTLRDAVNARRAEAHWKKALLAERSLMAKDWQGSDEEYIDLISNAAASVKLQPDNVHYRYNLNVYRWRSISRMINPNTGGMLIASQTLKFAQQIVDELHKARTLCPMFGQLYCVAGQIEKWVLHDPQGAEHIRISRRLAPCDPIVCLSAGVLAAEVGDVEATFRELNRAVELEGRLFKEAAVVCVYHLNRPDMAVTMAGDNTHRLSQLANILAEFEEYKPVADQTCAQIVELLKHKCAQPDAPAWAFASLAYICAKEDNKETAIENYRRAITLNYGQVDWRFRLAKLLADVGAIPEAIHEASVCLRLRPQCVKAKKLIEELSLHSEVEVITSFGSKVVDYQKNREAEKKPIRQEDL
jgi:tetratricopeptide (TPR) repeat protein/O-antigen ligase